MLCVRVVSVGVASKSVQKKQEVELIFVVVALHPFNLLLLFPISPIYRHIEIFAFFYEFFSRKSELIMCLVCEVVVKLLLVKVVLYLHEVQ